MADTTDDDLEEPVAGQQFESMEGLTAIADLDEETKELVAAQQVDMQMRMMLASALGENVAGGDTGVLPDYYEIFDWDPNPSTRDFYALALRNPYAYAVTFLPSSTSWRNPPKIVDDAEPDGAAVVDADQTQFEEDVEELAREQDLWDYCKRADKLAGIGDFGVLVMVFDDVQQDDVDDEAGMLSEDTFADPVDGAEQLVDLRPFSRLSVQNIKLGGPGSGRGGEPVEYEIDLRDENDEEFDVRRTGDLETSHGGPKTLRVHHSRVIHIHSETLLDDEMRGIARQQPVYNNLIDIEKALGSAGELAYRASAWGININIDKDYQLEDDNALTEHLHRWQVGLENVLRTHGADEVQNLGGEEIDPSNIIDPNIEAICAYLGIPQSVLKGNETGERATSEDLVEWYGKIQERRQEFVTPTIVRELIDRLIEHDIIATPDHGPSAYSVEWKPLKEMSEDQVAEIQKDRSETQERLAGIGLTREQRLEYVRDGTLPTAISDVTDDIAELEDVEASATGARDVEEITAGYEAAVDGGEEVDDGD